MGGTLVQHIDEHMRIDMYNQDVHDGRHRPGVAPGDDPRHRGAGRQLDAPSGASIGSARGVRAVAHNDDGHIEAIEIDAAPAVLGVQWHPEMLRHRADHLSLFEDLVRQVVARRG